MRLFLSSNGISSLDETKVQRLKDLIGKKQKVLFIDNAKDYLSEVDRKTHVNVNREHFEAIGFEWEELDLREYFKDNDGLAERVQNHAFIWVSGGNTFILRRAMAYSGFDNIVQTHVRTDSLVYGGSSAGAILVTKTLRGAESGDDPYNIPNCYQAEIIWQGLSLIDVQIVPHYQSEWLGAESMIDYFETIGLTYETLRDGEALIIDDKKIEKLSTATSS